MMVMSDYDRQTLFRKLKRELTPLCRDKAENYQHGMCKARCADWLRRYGYRITIEKSVPCNDIIDLTYVHPFSLDVYGELYPKVPNDSAIWASSADLLEWKPIDVIAIEIGGDLETYHGKRKFKVREKNKKEMVCSQYGISPDRYFVLEKDWVFSSKWMASDRELLEKLNLQHGM